MCLHFIHSSGGPCPLPSYETIFICYEHALANMFQEWEGVVGVGSSFSLNGFTLPEMWTERPRVISILFFSFNLEEQHIHVF